MTTKFSGLSDRDLISEVKRLAQAERNATAALVASLAEMDARRLYLGEGCSSLFTYCTRVLHLSEHAAYGRIEAARAARRFPAVLERLESGELTLSNLALLRPHLTDENFVELIDTARFASKRDVERLVARVTPRPDAPAMIRKVPTPTVGDASAPAVAPQCTVPDIAAADELTVPASAAGPRTEPAAGNAQPSLRPSMPQVTARDAVLRPQIPLVRPLAPDRYKIQFTVGTETHDKLRRAQDLMRHAIPDGDPAAIFDRALTVLLDRLERTKLAVARRPRGSLPVADGSRHIPAAVRRAVSKRDEGRCAFEGPEGRCGETGFLEFHHVIPFARGGRTTVDNVQLRCRAHNQYEAVEEFGYRALFTRETTPAYLVDSPFHAPAPPG